MTTPAHNRRLCRSRNSRLRPTKRWNRWLSALAPFLFLATSAAQTESSIHGDITDESGACQPLVPVTAWLTRTDRGSEQPVTVGTTTTDANGKFQFAPLPVPQRKSGALWLVAGSAESLIGGTPVFPGNLSACADQGLRVMIAAIDPFEGRLVTNRNQSPQGAVVGISSISRAGAGNRAITASFPPHHRLPGLFAACDAEGAFRITGTGPRSNAPEPARRIGLSVSADTLASGPYQIDESKWLAHGSSLQPFLASSIGGRLLRQGKASPVGNRHIRFIAHTDFVARPPQYPAWLDQYTTTDQNGAFRMGSLPPGEYSIHLDREEAMEWTHLDPPAPHLLGEGSNHNLEIPVLRGRPLAGEVVDETKRPVAGAKLNVSRRSGGRFVCQTTADSHGKFATRVPAGSYRIQVVDAPATYLRLPETAESGANYGPDVVVDVPADHPPVRVRFAFHRGTMRQQ